MSVPRALTKSHLGILHWGPRVVVPASLLPLSHTVTAGSLRELNNGDHAVSCQHPASVEEGGIQGVSGHKCSWTCVWTA